ncbi:hypothetical protein L1049_004317 [Liquidambar formosana]|uniref:Uncharacterized protein n=1 Tax=Liquidambar formosana TaxID=63359 RepID=A0AAP0RTM6_LIQFO
MERSHLVLSSTRMLSESKLRTGNSPTRMWPIVLQFSWIWQAEENPNGKGTGLLPLPHDRLHVVEVEETAS